MTTPPQSKKEKTEVSKQEFKNVAPWTTEEKILSPILFTVGIVGVLVGLGIIPTDGLSTLGWTVGTPLLVVALYALWTSYSRKKKSTLFTTVKDRKVHVWMHKPSKVRWDNRLSEGINVADLTELSLISFEEVNGTKVLRLHTGPKAVLVPWRLVGSKTDAGEAIKTAVAEELSLEGRRIKFHDDATEKSVRDWIAGKDLVFVAPKKAARPNYSQVGSSSKAKSKSSTASAAPEVEEELFVPAAPAKPQRHIGYQKYTQAPAMDTETSVEYAVSNGIASLDESEARKVEEDEAIPGYAGNLLLGDSVTIVVDDKK